MNWIQYLALPWMFVRPLLMVFVLFCCAALLLYGLLSVNRSSGRVGK